MSYVKHKFFLDPYTIDALKDMEPEWGYGGFGEFIFYRTYSRIKEDGSQENWADVVIRCIEGTMSIRKDWYIKNSIPWLEKGWQSIAYDMAISMFQMKWLPPGRGLWAMGTSFIYERGGMALYNCGYTDIDFTHFDSDLGWMMDSLMLGVGVGFSPIRDEYNFKYPNGVYDFRIPDSREGWVDGLIKLIQAYMYGASRPHFIYDDIRAKGLPIKGFGGIASGPEPLAKLYKFVEESICRYMEDKYYDSVILKSDIGNQIGCCVVAGNVRRSAELACLDINDPTFKKLKDYREYPERELYGWMSNNSSILKKNKDFEKLHELAEANRNRSDLGYLNLRNFPFGRIGKKDKLTKDKAHGVNPCGEIPLENKELCNVDDTFPTRCENPDEWYNACRYATIYCSTVSLLPTHQPDTNRIIAKNRRIGVGVCGVTSWIEQIGMSKVTKHLRKGYKTVRHENQLINAEAGIPESIRVTTVKPNGTTSKLVGVTPGVSYPNFHHMIRRVRVARNVQIHNILVMANVPYENDLYSANTDIFEFPIKMDENVKEVGEVSVWEQAMNLILLQREWADNSVSNTLMFRPKWILYAHHQQINVEDQIEIFLEVEGYEVQEVMKILYRDETWESDKWKIEIKWDQNIEEILEGKIYSFDSKHEEDSLEAVLASIAPLTKTVSMLPYAPNIYPQMPEEGINEEEYHRRLSLIKRIDWSELKGSDGIDERYCDSDKCVI
jgi:ribonucleoside-triphosphate reductase (thioredoxin)